MTDATINDLDIFFRRRTKNMINYFNESNGIEQAIQCTNRDYIHPAYHQTDYLQVFKSYMEIP